MPIYTSYSHSITQSIDLVGIVTHLKAIMIQNIGK